MTSGFDPVQMILPVFVLTLYGFGYIARMTRASMAEVMTTPYIRTAVLKGLPYRRIIMKHALRNALIAPFTVIMLQINWLLSGVVVTEFAFGYKDSARCCWRRHSGAISSSSRPAARRQSSLPSLRKPWATSATPT